MKIINLIQGTPEWRAHRATHFNASDAPAMMGVSPYKTRNQLLHELHTGITPEVDAATQRRFDEGHRFEALARPLAETIIGEELYPVVGTAGKFSASFDGLTLLEDVAFEHKRLNNDLRAAMFDGCTGADLPMHYQIQMEHQALVSDCEKVLFMASNWDSEDQLIEERNCWYTPNLELREAIIAGWAQFGKDLAAYVPPVVTAAPVVAAPVENLPAVSVRLSGQLAVVSNLPTFSDALREFIARIPAQPSTDQEFADTDAACKTLKKAEDALKASESMTLAEMADVEAMRRTVADLSELARKTRLQFEKLVAHRKEQIRSEIVADGVEALRLHVKSLNTNWMPVETMRADFGGAIKGKKTVAGVQSAVDDALARAKIAANKVADGIKTNLEMLKLLAKPQHKMLFADIHVIVIKAPEDFEALANSRIAEHDAAEAKRLEAERERIRYEEQVKAKREAAMAEAAKQKAQAEEQASVIREAARLEAEKQKACVEDQTKVLFETEPLPGHQSGESATLPVEDAPILVLPEAPEPAQVAAQVAIEPGVEAICLGQINERLAPICITEAGLLSTGFAPFSVVKNAKMYRESDFEKICVALTHHLMGCIGIPA